MRTDLGSDLTADANRHADDDKIGAGDGGGAGLHHLIGNSKLGDAPACADGASGRHDLADCTLRAGCACDRRANQADADQREPIVQRRLRAHVEISSDTVPRTIKAFPKTL
jgi:hypothetical protein